MVDYYEFVGVDLNGKSRTYQHKAPSSETESAILEHLIRTFKNLKIINFRKITTAELKPATGEVHRRAYNHGIIDQVERLLGGNRAAIVGKSLLRVAEGNHTQRRSMVADGMDEFNEVIKPIEGELTRSLLAGSRLNHTQSLLRRLRP